MGTSIEQIEHAAKTAWDRGDFTGVVTVLMESYGDEVHAFVVASARGDLGIADEVFSQFTEDLWRGLPKFEWRSSLRAWCYKIARNALHRYRRAPHNRRDRRAGLSDAQVLERLADSVRSRTRPYLRSEVKSEFEKLREKLSEEDQSLLILRINRKLAWREVAHALMAETETANDAEIERLATALRQRLVEVKARLKRLAQEAGLLDP
jgi:RNA polymerase sigma-70 factor, ECF subfamily